MQQLIADFLDSFALFGDAWLAAILLAALLPLAGVILVAREQVFAGAAIGQAATFGVAVALVLEAHRGPAVATGVAHGESLGTVLALAGGVAVAVASLRTLSGRGSSLESTTTWVFLAAGAGSVLLLAGAPHGMHEVQRLQLSSLLGASPGDKWIAAAALVGSLVLLRIRREPILLWIFDPITARVLGVRVASLDLLIGGWLGLVLGFAIHATGLLFTFGAAVLPVLAVRPWAGSLGVVVRAAPWIGAAGATVGLLAAHAADLPPGQVAVAVLALLVPLGAVAGRRRR